MSDSIFKETERLIEFEHMVRHAVRSECQNIMGEMIRIQFQRLMTEHGFNLQDPENFKRDLIFLRDLRDGSEYMRRRGWGALVAAFFTAIGVYLWHSLPWAK